jgi:uncharacterized protein with HEPN domain
LSLRRDPRAYLWDVREAANAIVEFTDGISEASYAASAITHSAVERKFEVIGEALNLLSKSDPVLASRIPELDKIVSFRNLLIHGYAVVEHGRVWAITRQELLSLRKTVAGLLAELGE